MARETKSGIDYFSHDTDLFHDPKIRFIKAKHGIIGYAIYIRLLEEIYHNEGYYIKLDEDYNILFVDENNLDLNVYIEALNDYIEKDLFNKKLYNDYNILTSKRVQNNYLDATVRRKNVEIIKEYLLVDVNILGSNVNILELNDNIQTTKKSKVNIKEKKRKESIVLQEEKNEEKEPLKETIPYKEIIDYLNLKTGKSYKHTTKKTQTMIKARWNEGNTKEDFFKVIDNARAFRLDNGGDLTYLRPTTLFNGDFESRLTGDSYGWTNNKEQPKKEMSENEKWVFGG